MLSSGRCLGVDASGKDIKVVELRRSGATYEVVQAARVRVTDGDKNTALWHFLLETRTEPSRVVCALPASSCSVKFASLPKSKPSDLARMVRFEAETQIPLPLEETAWDYAVDQGADEEMCHVVIAGARKELVDATLAEMETVRIDPIGIMVSSLAASRSVAAFEEPEDAPVLVVDIGEGWTDFCAVDRGRVIACRSVELGGSDLHRAFESDFGPEEAEHLKTSRGVEAVFPAEGGSEGSAVERWIENLALEIRRSAISLIAGGMERRLGRAVLVGGTAGINGLCKALEGRTGLPMEIGDPWVGMSLSQVASHTQRELSASFAVATGLALSGLDGEESINLLPHQRAHARVKERREIALMSGLGALSVILFVVLLFGRLDLQHKSSQVSDLGAQLRQIRREIGPEQPKLRASATAVRDAVAVVEQGDAKPIELLRQLSVSLPRSVWLSEFTIESGKSLVLKGRALSNSAVADAIDTMSRMEVFKSVDLNYSNLVQADGSQVYDFQITCALTSRAGSTTASTKSNGSARTGIVVR